MDASKLAGEPEAGGGCANATNFGEERGEYFFSSPELLFLVPSLLFFLTAREDWEGGGRGGFGDATADIFLGAMMSD